MSKIVPVALLTLVVLLAGCGGGGGVPGPTPSARLIVVAKDERFDPAQLQVPAGSVSVQLDNQDDNVLHNIRFYKGANADGAFIRKSDIKRGVRTDTLIMKLDAGTYFYDCEVHPASMTGSLTVN